MESAGAKLKKIRLEKGISLEDVHKKTRIHLNILKAIEEDNFVGQSPVYIKGFLKIYCNFLGVNPEGFLTEVKKPAEAVPQKIEQPKKEKEKAKEKQPSLFEGAMANLDAIRPRVSRTTLITILIFIILAFALFKLGKYISYRRTIARERAAQQPAPVKKELPKPKPVKAASKPKSAVPLPVKEEQEVSIPRSLVKSGIKLTIRTREDCWVQLKADGKVVFQSVLKRGRSEAWEAKEKIELSLGNAGVVDLEVNGKLISSLGRKGQAIKNIMISREGLTVPR